MFLKGLSSVISSILGASGKKIHVKLSLNGKLKFEDVKDSINKNVKKSAEEIHLAICGSLDYAERRYLKLLLDKIDSFDSEIIEIQVLMFKLASPYKVQIEQLDSIPGLDVGAALAIIAETSATPHTNFCNEKKLVAWAVVRTRGSNFVK